MEIWFVLITTVCIAFLLNALLSLKSKSTLKLPPGPVNVPILTTILWLRKSGTEIETTIRNLSSKFGPIITVPVGLRPAIFVSSRELAHEALVHKGAIFADRPQPVPTAKVLTSNQHNISSAGYGPKWRTFRRNLTSEMLHPSRAKEFRHARKWVLDILLDRLRASAMSEGQCVKVIEHSRFAMFCLLVTMCFGEKLDESKIREIEEIMFALLTSFRRFGILDRWPSMTRILLRGRWNELYDMKKKRHDLLVPLIRRRKQLKDQGGIINDGEGSELAVSYVDTLKAVVLEGLRRHPPGHFVLQHAVTQDVELGGYLIPKDATINFTVAEMGRDPEVWEDPMEFRPERFMTGQEEFDITGSHEIKMMPFGVGRRICPGYGLAMHHLEYYVANLVWNFEWRAADGYEVDLSEKQEFTVVMKHPLHAIVSPRQNN